MQFEPDDEDKLTEAGVPLQLQNCGYESHNALMNLNTIAVIVFLMCFRLVLALIFRCIIKRFTKKKTFECMRKYTRWCFSPLFYREPLQLAIDSSLEFMTAAFITFSVMNVGKSGETLGIILSCLGLSLALILLPIGVFTLLCSTYSQKQLHSSKYTFNFRWQPLIEMRRVQTTMQRSFFLWYLLRRVLFLVVAFWIVSDLHVTF